MSEGNSGDLSAAAHALCGTPLPLPALPGQIASVGMVTKEREQWGQVEDRQQM